MSPIPSECEIAVREWSPIVDAIDEGKQAILIHNRGPAHDCFFLLPTYTFASEKDFLSKHFRADSHSLVEKSVSGREKCSQLAECFCRVEKIINVGSDELDKLRNINDHHIWTTDHVVAYLRRRDKGHDAFVWILRAYRLPQPQRVHVPRGPMVYVRLESPVSLRDIAPVLSDSAFAGIVQTIETKLWR